MLGIALDGFPIFGPYDETGRLLRHSAPSAVNHGSSAAANSLTEQFLDECNGRFVNGRYQYHFSVDAPFSPTCLRGELMNSMNSMSGSRQLAVALSSSQSSTRALVEAPGTRESEAIGKGSYFEFEAEATEACPVPGGSVIETCRQHPQFLWRLGVEETPEWSAHCWLGFGVFFLMLAVMFWWGYCVRCASFCVRCPHFAPCISLSLCISQFARRLFSKYLSAHSVVEALLFHVAT